MHKLIYAAVVFIVLLNTFVLGIAVGEANAEPIIQEKLIEKDKIVIKEVEVMVEPTPRWTEIMYDDFYDVAAIFEWDEEQVLLAIAIAKHETGNFTSNAYRNYNNLGGIMYWNSTTRKSELVRYKDGYDGLYAFIKLLNNRYFKLGLDTIETIQPVYAPVGVANDPNNLNSHWVKGVHRHLNELKED